ncbi:MULTISPECIES: hypothetical protein [Pontibacillus]|uniref:Uncharacterized protein n=1 Tax=Pontibacillus chungwhensis TaxID=265426 RepID=A0ABY8UYN8_9BACI|nr:MULTISPECIES: hypothetical protein [Pontibacillus]MCD5325490.1 hypothetical protein [Pontibacillus sp. HN14]WIF98602.1 hypothetical protein QNI29_02725 [Pontibacillus chungwhensis]
MERAKRFVVVQTPDCFFILSSYDYQGLQKVWGYVDVVAAFPTRKQARRYIEKRMQQGNIQLDTQGYAVYRDESGQLKYIDLEAVQGLRQRFGWFPIEGKFSTEKEALSYIIHTQSTNPPSLPHTS